MATRNQDAHYFHSFIKNSLLARLGVSRRRARRGAKSPRGSEQQTRLLSSSSPGLSECATAKKANVSQPCMRDARKLRNDGKMRAESAGSRRVATNNSVVPLAKQSIVIYLQVLASLFSTFRFSRHEPSALAEQRTAKLGFDVSWLASPLSRFTPASLLYFLQIETKPRIARIEN